MQMPFCQEMKRFSGRTSLKAQKRLSPWSYRKSELKEVLKYFCIFQLVRPFTGTDITAKTIFFQKSPFHWERILCLTIQRTLFRDFNCSVDLWLDLNNQNNKIVGFFPFFDNCNKMLVVSWDS